MAQRNHLLGGFVGAITTITALCKWATKDSSPKAIPANNISTESHGTFCSGVAGNVSLETGLFQLPTKAAAAAPLFLPSGSSSLDLNGSVGNDTVANPVLSSSGALSAALSWRVLLELFIVISPFALIFLFLCWRAMRAVTLRMATMLGGDSLSDACFRLEVRLLPIGLCKVWRRVWYYYTAIGVYTSFLAPYVLDGLPKGLDLWYIQLDAAAVLAAIWTKPFENEEKFINLQKAHEELKVIHSSLKSEMAQVQADSDSRIGKLNMKLDLAEESLQKALGTAKNLEKRLVRQEEDFGNHEAYLFQKYVDRGNLLRQRKGEMKDKDDEIQEKDDAIQSLSGIVVNQTSKMLSHMDMVSRSENLRQQQVQALKKERNELRVQNSKLEQTIKDQGPKVESLEDEIQSFKDCEYNFFRFHKKNMARKTKQGEQKVAKKDVQMRNLLNKNDAQMRSLFNKKQEKIKALEKEVSISEDGQESWMEHYEAEEKRAMAAEQKQAEYISQIKELNRRLNTPKEAAIKAAVQKEAEKARKAAEKKEADHEAHIKELETRLSAALEATIDTALGETLENERQAAKQKQQEHESQITELQDRLDSTQEKYESQITDLQDRLDFSLEGGIETTLRETLEEDRKAT